MNKASLNENYFKCTHSLLMAFNFFIGRSDEKVHFRKTPLEDTLFHNANIIQLYTLNMPKMNHNLIMNHSIYL